MEKSTNSWIEQIFRAEEAHTGGVVRREKKWVEHFKAFDALKCAVAARGWHLIELTDQYVVICDPSPMRIIVQ